MISVLALDLGIRTGWALAEKGRIESGVQQFDLKRGESPGMRWLRFDRWLEEVAPMPRIQLVVYEAVLGRFARGQAQTFIASNFAGRVESFCARHGLEHAPVPGATLKKFTTGKGNADKAAMRVAAHRRGWLEGEGEPAWMSEDEVDAQCLLRYALAELVPDVMPAMWAKGAGARDVS